MFRKSFETSLIISLKKDNMPYLAVFRKTFLIGKYSNFNFQKKTNENPIGRRHFLWNHERSEVLRKAAREQRKATRESRKAARESWKAARKSRKAAREWVRKACVPNYDAPPLPTASEASGNDLPTYLPKKFLWFFFKFTDMEFR